MHLAFCGTRQFSARPCLQLLQRCLKCLLKLEKTSLSFPLQMLSQTGTINLADFDIPLKIIWYLNSRVKTQTAPVCAQQTYMWAARVWSPCSIMIRSGPDFLVKICQEKRISTHSWMHFREQFPFVIGRAHAVYRPNENAAAFWCTVPIAGEIIVSGAFLGKTQQDSLWCRKKFWGRAQKQKIFYFPSLLPWWGEYEGEELAAGCVPALPPVVSRITTLHVDSSK